MPDSAEGLCMMRCALALAWPRGELAGANANGGIVFFDVAEQETDRCCADVLISKAAQPGARREGSVS